MNISAANTAELCDRHANTAHLQIAEPLFTCYGQQTAFAGKITTLKVFEDSALLHSTLEQPAEERILVVDGGGSHRCALLDAPLAELAVSNGWQGLVIYGCIRNSTHIGRLPLGVYALHTHPLKSHKHGHGEQDILLTFAGVNFRAGHYLYADEDGIIVSPTPLD